MNSKPSLVPLDSALPVAQPRSAVQALGRSLLLRQLARLEHGEIRLIERERSHRFGRRTDRCPFSVTLRVHDPRFFADATFGGTVGAGECYIDGAWSCDDLTALVRIMVVNRDLMNGMDSRWAMLSTPFLKLFHALNRNSRSGSARNIAAHYDLSNELFEIMLDETMAYSCAVFPTPQSSLHEGQTAKFERVCRKLELKPGERLLEIGTGWGGLAIHAARHYGCHVTTTTISREQHDYTRERIAREGLADRIDLRLEDYRDLKGDLGGRYDKLVSIEMVEAVGPQFLDTYFARCSALLEPQGAMLLQAITIRDQLYAQALRSVDFIQRFVFPGSFIPSVSALTAAAARATDLKLSHLEDIGPHYARTLRLWRERFFTGIDRVRTLGLPERFVRLWEFYLCYCEGGFEERQLGDVHMLFTKPQSRLEAARS